MSKNDILTKPQKYQVNPNAVDKTPDKDTVQLSSGLTTKEKVGIAAVATTIVAGALAILGRNGHLGESVQKFLGGKAKKAAQEMGEHTHTPKPPVESKAPAEPKAPVESKPPVESKVPAESKAPVEQKPNVRAEQEAESVAQEGVEHIKTPTVAQTTQTAKAKSVVKSCQNLDFVEQHKHEALEKLVHEGEELWGANSKKYDGLIRKFAKMQQKGFESIKGQRDVQNGRHVVVQQLGKGTKTSGATMTYYSKDGKVIDEIVCTRNNKKAYDVSFTDKGKTVDLETGELIITGSSDGISGMMKRKDGVYLNVYNDGYLYEINRNDTNGVSGCLTMRGTTDCTEVSFDCTESDLRKYLNIKD